MKGVPFVQKLIKFYCVVWSIGGWDWCIWDHESGGSLAHNSLVTRWGLGIVRPRRQKGRGFQKCIHTSQIKSIFNHSTQHFHIFSDARKKVEDSRNAHIHLRLNQFSITAHNIFTYDTTKIRQKIPKMHVQCTHISDLVKLQYNIFTYFRRKVWTRAKCWSPNICYFVAIWRFVAFYARFGNFWA